jgi:hypothetical protein
MGDVVNSACHLRGKAGRNGRKKIVVSKKVYNNILDESKKFFTSFWVDGKLLYESDFIYHIMEVQYNKNCK